MGNIDLEELGYTAIWYPEVIGRDPFVAGALLAPHLLR